MFSLYSQTNPFLPATGSFLQNFQSKFNWFFAQLLKWNDELQARNGDETYDLNCWQEERERKEQEDQRKKQDEDAKKKKALTNMTHQHGGIQQRVSVYQHINV